MSLEIQGGVVCLFVCFSVLIFCSPFLQKGHSNDKNIAHDDASPYPSQHSAAAAPAAAGGDGDSGGGGGGLRWR